MSVKRRATSPVAEYLDNLFAMESHNPRPYPGNLFRGRPNTPVSPEYGSDTTDPSHWYNDYAPAILPITIKRTTSLHYLLFGKGTLHRDRCEQHLDPFFLPSIPSPASDTLKDPCNYHKVEKSETKWLDLTEAPNWGEGCAAEFPGLGGTKMLVPSDWETTYDYLVSSGQEAVACGMGVGAHVAIRGGTGIGKKSCLDYLFFRRLLEGKPVVWRSRRGDFVFSKEGSVFWKKEDTKEWLEKAEMEFGNRGGEVWLISMLDDVDEWDQGYKCLRVIGAGEKWEKWVEEKNIECIWMDAWSWEEFFLLKNFYSFPISTANGVLEEREFVERLWTIYYRFGGEPLLLKKLRPYLPGDQFEKNLLDYQAVIERACRKMARANVGPNSQSGISSNVRIATEFSYARKITYEDEVVTMVPAFGSNTDSDISLGGKRAIYIGLDHTPRLRTRFIADIFDVQRTKLARY